MDHEARRVPHTGGCVPGALIRARGRGDVKGGARVYRRGGAKLAYLRHTLLVRR